MEIVESLKKTSLVGGALLGALATLPLMALSYLGAQLYALPFVPFDIFDWLARILPGGVITFVIDKMVSVITALNLGETSSVAKLVEQGLALVQLVAIGALVGLALAAINRGHNQVLRVYGLLAGVVLTVSTLLVESSLGFPSVGVLPSILWVTALYIAWGLGLAWLIENAGPALAASSGAEMSRQEFLRVSGVGIAAVTLGAWGLGRLFGRRGAAVGSADVVSPTPLPGDPYGTQLTSGPAASPSLEELNARLAPVPGTRPELTSNEDFYRIDINTLPQAIDGESWRLKVTGLVDREREFTLAELRAFPAVSQILTMQCISNRIAGDLTGATRWTGARLKDVLAEVGMREGARALYIEAVDGFYETVSFDDLLDDRTLLVYEMNGVPLPVEHGYPLRVYIPNRYGMKQPKWITSMEVVDEHVDGYWVVRGWDPEAYVQTVSVIDSAVQVDENGGTILVGGMAWAGARGVGKVEVQVNNADWHEAELISPALSPLSWVLWRLELPYEAGRYSFRVRAYDGDGQIQEEAVTPPHPDGATGLHQMAVRL